MTKEYKEKITLYLDRRLRKDLEALGERKGLKLSVLIRNLLTEYLNEK